MEDNIIFNNTIVASATAFVNQAISIIRLSGDDAYKIINKVFSKKVLIPKNKNAIVYGYIINSDKEIIDQVLLMCFKKPSSFTGEHLIEINCHGGVYITQKIIHLLISNGAKPAKRGEFSKQAFLNGKISLLQADSINNLIFSNNDISSKMAINTICGYNTSEIKSLRKKILDIIANVEVNIDYPEYDGVGDLKPSDIIEKIKNIQERFQSIYQLSKIGKLINDGIKTVIIGKPNVGKSSFLNALLNEEKAIVSNIKGTTRDIVEGIVNIGGITLNLMDTAGIRQSSNIIERIGIDKSKQAIKNSDLVLLILDPTQELDNNDLELLKLTNKENRLVIFNKSDLNSESVSKYKNNIKIKEKIINVSAKNRNITEFIEYIQTRFYNIELTKKENLILVNNIQINILEKILKELKIIYNNLCNDVTIDIININLNNLWELLGKLLGHEYEENILDTIFNNYCLGK